MAETIAHYRVERDEPGQRWRIYSTADPDFALCGAVALVSDLEIMAMKPVWSLRRKLRDWPAGRALFVVLAQENRLGRELTVDDILGL